MYKLSFRFDKTFGNYERQNCKLQTSIVKYREKFIFLQKSCNYEIQESQNFEI